MNRVDAIIRNASRLKEIIESLTSGITTRRAAYTGSFTQRCHWRVIEDGASLLQMAADKNNHQKTLPPDRNYGFKSRWRWVADHLGNELRMPLPLPTRAVRLFYAVKKNRIM